MTSVGDSRLRSAVAAFFIISAAANLLMVVAFGDLYRRYFTLRYQQSPVGTTALGDSVEGAMALLLAVTVVTAVVFAGLAALTLLRPRPWVLHLDTAALLAAGGPTVVGRLLEVFSPTHASLPPVFGQTQLLLSIVAVALAAAIVISHRARRLPTIAEQA